MADMTEVYLNGVNVTNDVDSYNGQDIKFNTAPKDGDEIYGIFYGSFRLVDAVLTTGDSQTIGDIEFSVKTKGVILLDRTKADSDGNPIKYRLLVDNGNLAIEEV